MSINLDQPVNTPNGMGIVCGRYVDGSKTEFLVSHHPGQLPDAISKSSLILDNRIIIRYRPDQISATVQLYLNDPKSALFRRIIGGGQ